MYTCTSWKLNYTLLSEWLDLLQSFIELEQKLWLKDVSVK